MKKTFLIVCVLLLVGVIPVFSFGIGGAFNYGFQMPHQAMLSVKFDTFPAVFGIGASIGYTSFQIGVTADWWLFHQHLFSIVDLYIGPGLYAAIGGTTGLGIRVPIGLRAFILDPLELFIEIAPSIGLRLSNPITFPTWGVQGAFGFRFWF